MSSVLALMGRDKPLAAPGFCAAKSMGACRSICDGYEYLDKSNLSGDARAEEDRCGACLEPIPVVAGLFVEGTKKNRLAAGWLISCFVAAGFELDEKLRKI